MVFLNRELQPVTMVRGQNRKGTRLLWLDAIPLIARPRLRPIIFKIPPVVLRHRFGTDVLNLVRPESSDPNQAPILAQSLQIDQAVLPPGPRLPAIITHLDFFQTPTDPFIRGQHCDTINPAISFTCIIAPARIQPVTQAVELAQVEREKSHQYQNPDRRPRPDAKRFSGICLSI